MSEKRIIISGYCPYLDEEHTIKALYLKYKPIGSSVAFATYQMSDCEYNQECPHYAECPVALQKTIW